MSFISDGDEAARVHIPPVRRETLSRLKTHKVGGISYDELLNDLSRPKHTRRVRLWAMGMHKISQRGAAAFLL